MASLRPAPRCNGKKGAPVSLDQAAQDTTDTRPSADTMLSELAELLRRLHQSLQDYAPMWYTQALNDRICEKLAAAERISAALPE